MNRRTGRLDLEKLLAAVENAPPVDAADVVGARLADALGAVDVAFLIADFSGDALIRLGHGDTPDGGRSLDRETAERVALAESPHGRALARQAIEIQPEDGGVRVFAPVTNRGEAIGILELGLPEAPDDDTLAEVALAAHALAYIVVANRRFTDLFEWGQRSVPLSLAAEIQHRLLPGSYTCEAGQFTLAAWLEPAGNVAGDTFDFSLDRDTLHVSITDAMGHDMRAALLATVLVGALRNARRSGVTLPEQARRAGAGLHATFQDRSFVTGQLARIDLETGLATIVNAGHPLPVRVRDGQSRRVTLAADPPFGTVGGHPYRAQDLPLTPGDRLVFITDGMLERNVAGLDIAGILAASAHLHPREAVQGLVRAVLDATNGDLKDDAAAICLDWYGGPPRERRTDSGANE